jgi:hypothetical protein
MNINSNKDRGLDYLEAEANSPCHEDLEVEAHECQLANWSWTPVVPWIPDTWWHLQRLIDMEAESYQVEVILLKVMLKRIGGGCWSESISDLEPQLPPDGVFKDLSRKPWRIFRMHRKQMMHLDPDSHHRQGLVTVSTPSGCGRALTARSRCCKRERGEGRQQEETRPATEQRDRTAGAHNRRRRDNNRMNWNASEDLCPGIWSN